MNPATDIKDYLVANTDLVFGTDLFIGVEPDEGDSQINVVTLFDYAGNSSDPKFNIDQENIQFRSRGESYLEGYNQLSDLKVLLEGLREDLILNGSRYFGFYVSSKIQFINRDKKERYIWTMNMQIKRNPADAGNRA